jgi:hypothetical protein
MLTAVSRARRLEADRVALGEHLATGIHQLVDHRIEAGRRHAGEPHVASRCRGGAQIGAGLDAVGHDAVGRAVQCVDALDADHVATGTGDARTHGVQAVGEVDHFRLARRVLDHGFAVGQRRRHHQVLGAGDGDHVAEHPGTFQAFGLRHGCSRARRVISAPIACRPLMC